MAVRHGNTPDQSVVVPGSHVSDAEEDSLQNAVGAGNALLQGQKAEMMSESEAPSSCKPADFYTWQC